MKATWYDARVTHLEHVSESKMTFSVQLQLDDMFSFRPGQFVTMDLPIGEKRRQRWRSYSIANISNAENILEFGIGRLDDGLASEYFFNQLQIGDTIKFKGPDGAFVLPENLDRPLVMIATGTGVVPFYSMLREIDRRDLTFQSIHLIYGTRYEKDILYRNQLQEITERHNNIKIDIVLSREEDWSGHKGYVHEIYKTIYSEKQDDILFLLCGWSAMIDEAMANLFPMVESPPRQIKYELYG